MRDVMSKNETKNTTILAMDVVGYSAKMNEDESGTTEKLKNARIIIEKLVKERFNLFIRRFIPSNHNC